MSNLNFTENNLACPECRGRIQFNDALSTDNKNQANANYFCVKCGCSYTIIEGIPQFITDDVAYNENNTLYSPFTSDHKQGVYWEKPHKFRTYEHPIVRLFAEQRLEHLQKLLDVKDISTALDVGCGDGFSTYYMGKLIKDVYGIDRSNFMLGRHPLKGMGRLFRADATKLPFADNSFDLVYAWEALHHISDPVSVLSEMIRVSRKYVLAIEPNRNNPAQMAFSLIDREHRWVLRFTLPYMRRLFEKAGMTVQHSSTGGWIFPNKTPGFLLSLLKKIPYKSSLGISLWVLGSKKKEEA